MDTIRLTTAQALVRFLDQQHVEFDGKVQKFVTGIFTIFGHGNVLGIGQALEAGYGGELAVYQGRNEQGMAHAAAAYAKQKHRRQIMACTSSVGPGAANMITAAAAATANQIPVLLLPGDTFASRQPDPVLQQIERPHDLTQTTNDAFKAVSRYWDRISRPEQVMTAMINAMRVLTDPAETGAVTIALPQDVQAEAYDFPCDFFAKRTHRIERRIAAPSALQEAAMLIARKKKPIMICGGGVHYSEAQGVFGHFAEQFHIPFGETQAGKGALSSSHPYNLGGIGVTGNLAANRAAAEADLVIGVGTRFTDFTTGSKRLFQNPDVEFLSVNISRYHAYKLDAAAVVGDAGSVLSELRDALHQRGYTSAYKGEIESARTAWSKELERLHQIRYDEQGFKPEVAGHCDGELPEFRKLLGSSLTQTEVIGLINREIDGDAIVVGASGSLPGDLQRMWVTHAPNTYHMEYGYSCMGYEIAGALGVKLAEPDKEVYAMTGDGSYLMLHSELLTSIQEGLKINVLLFDNASFGCINNLQMANGMGSFVTEFRHRNPATGKLDGALMAVDYALSASGYGLKTYRATTLRELSEALQDARKQTVSTLIDIKVLPKTMTNGYESWWHVGVAGASENTSVQEAFRDKQRALRQARRY